MEAFLNHGGIEMGQGTHKIAQLVSHSFRSTI